MDGDLGRAVDGGSGRGCWWLLGHCAASAGTGGRSSAVRCPEASLELVPATFPRQSAFGAVSQAKDIRLALRDLPLPY
ncbi:unnamed protein product [Cladocopium goreaui]|uniref:Uncharacterized protein n=1 Tax=Cladocopium goreaui TaxID=2562237 RepID=A0A9P1FS35_9DINO|nr:unnamed protein product [Cladocopium goreaui]